MTATDLDTGIVISSHRDRVLVSDQQDKLWVLRHGKDRAVSGDHVQWRQSGDTEGLVVTVLPRHSLVYRPTERGPGKPIAANVDQLVLVIAPVPAYLPRLIDRYLVISAYFEIPACLVFNKLDLMDATGLLEAKAALAVYTQIEIPSFWVSAKRGQGLETLCTFLEAKKSILVGQSGVGKSSITKRITTDVDIAIQKLSSRGTAGRHTTSHTTLYPLTNKGWIADSPGVREFALWQIPSEDIATGFSEFQPYLGQCRFRDCRHDAEPGCAITQAAEQGAISWQRLQSYREMIGK